MLRGVALRGRWHWILPGAYLALVLVVGLLSLGHYGWSPLGLALLWVSIALREPWVGWPGLQDRFYLLWIPTVNALLLALLGMLIDKNGAAIRRAVSSRLAMLIIGVLYVCWGIMARAYAIEHFRPLSGPAYIWWVLSLVPLTVVIALTTVPFRKAALLICLFVLTQLIVASSMFPYYLAWSGIPSLFLYAGWWKVSVYAVFGSLVFEAVNLLIQLAVLRVVRTQLGRRRLALNKT